MEAILRNSAKLSMYETAPEVPAKALLQDS